MKMFAILKFTVHLNAINLGGGVYLRLHNITVTFLNQENHCVLRNTRIEF